MVCHKGLLLVLRMLAGLPALDHWSMRLSRRIAERPVRALVPVTAVLLAPWAVALLNVATIRGA